MSERMEKLQAAHERIIQLKEEFWEEQKRRTAESVEQLADLAVEKCFEFFEAIANHSEFAYVALHEKLIRGLNVNCYARHQNKSNVVELDDGILKIYRVPGTSVDTMFDALRPKLEAAGFIVGTAMNGDKDGMHVSIPIDKK